MEQKLFTLAKDCMFEDQQLSEGDIVLIIPTSADDKSIREGFDEDNVDYRSMFSITIYDMCAVEAAAEDGGWIYSYMPKYVTYVNSDWLPDLFFELPIVVAKYSFNGILRCSSAANFI